MVETVVSIGLAVDEKIVINKNRIKPLDIMGDEKRICIVTGINGDELEGQYICYEIIKKIHKNIKCLKGIVDIYPALNPIGIDSITREMPMFNLDMNRIFPGAENGSIAEHIAAKIIKDIEGTDICIDIHSSNIFLREIPQVRISEENSEKLIPYAKLLNTDFVWVQPLGAVRESTLSSCLNRMNIPTLLVEMGVGMRITKSYGDDLVKGIFNLMKELGIWCGEVDAVKEPLTSVEGEVVVINAETSGIFIPSVEHFNGIKRGEHVGDIISPLNGTIEQSLESPCDGMIFTLREYPVVYNGSIIARVLGGCSK